MVEEQGAFGRIEILRLRAVAIAAEKPHRDERVKEIGDGPRVKLQFRAQFRPNETTPGEFGEHAEFDGRQQDFGMPKTESGLQYGRGIERGGCQMAIGLNFAWLDWWLRRVAQMRLLFAIAFGK